MALTKSRSENPTEIRSTSLSRTSRAQGNESLMGEAKKRRHCPAIGREISAADCGENRQSRHACPESCEHNPFNIGDQCFPRRPNSRALSVSLPAWKRRDRTRSGARAETAAARTRAVRSSSRRLAPTGWERPGIPGSLRFRPRNARIPTIRIGGRRTARRNCSSRRRSSPRLEGRSRMRERELRGTCRSPGSDKGLPDRVSPSPRSGRCRTGNRLSVACWGRWDSRTTRQFRSFSLLLSPAV